MEKQIFRSKHPEKDWIKDFEHENGNYTNVCIKCGYEFTGHKRRVVCHECTYPTNATDPVLDFSDVFHYVKSIQALTTMNDEEAGTLYHILDMWQQKRYFEPATYELTNVPKPN